MDNNRGSGLRTVAIMVTAIAAVVGVAAYMTYFGINSNAAVNVCITGRFCKTNLQCGTGRCVISLKKGRSDGRWVPEVPFGRCNCVKP